MKSWAWNAHDGASKTILFPHKRHPVAQVVHFVCFRCGWIICCLCRWGQVIHEKICLHCVYLSNIIIQMLCSLLGIMYMDVLLIITVTETCLLCYFPTLTMQIHCLFLYRFSHASSWPLPLFRQTGTMSATIGWTATKFDTDMVPRGWIPLSM